MRSSSSPWNGEPTSRSRVWPSPWSLTAPGIPRSGTQHRTTPRTGTWSRPAIGGPRLVDDTVAAVVEVHDLAPPVVSVHAQEVRHRGPHRRRRDAGVVVRLPAQRGVPVGPHHP